MTSQPTCAAPTVEVWRWAPWRLRGDLQPGGNLTASTLAGAPNRPYMHKLPPMENYHPHVPQNPISAHPNPEDGRRGHTLPLRSLAPDFKEDHHRLYVDLLERAIADEDSHNVALTGAYGTGKSSILTELRKSRRPRGKNPWTWFGTAKRYKVLDLSLSTITPDAHDASAESRTNLIQKELVKQLLYRLRPHKVPQSRFDRPNVHRRWVAWVAWLVAAFVGCGVVGLALFLGVEPYVSERFSSGAQQWVVYGLAAALVMVLARGIGHMLRGRLEVSASLTSGPATVTLANEPKTYFDEFLDQLVYVFQASKCNVVFIEDIDRYEDVLVFDTLRSLNTLLNQSEQIGRRIVFVYAIRDSVFDAIGSAPRPGEGEQREPGTGTNADDSAGTAPRTDAAKSGIGRASRTKFFDVIIPVVPFVSSHNARDLMKTAMEDYDSKVEAALIRLASRHVPDMRMIHNIRNEFEIYHDRLLVKEVLASGKTRRKIPGNNPTRVFALVLFKNTHLADFERIRHQESSLDRLHAKWRELVRSGLEADSAALVRLRRSRDLERTATRRAAHLGTLLEGLRVRLETSIEPDRYAVSATLLAPAGAQTLDDPGVWEQIAAGAHQRIELDRYTSSIVLSFSPSELSRLMGVNLNPSEWKNARGDEIDAEIVKIESRMALLRASDWEALCRRPQYKLETDGVSQTFDELVDQELDSELAKDLVRHGFITTNFAQYVSTYYGTHMGPNAWDYTDRYIGPGTPDKDFLLTEDDVREILIDQKAEKSDTADLFTDVSIYNINIVDYLIKHRSGAAAKLAERLTRWGPQEREFVDAYVARGADPAGLLAAMARTWADAVHYAAVTAPVDASSRTAIVDAVLHALPADKYAPGEGDRAFMEAHYEELSAITDPGSEERARVTLGVMKACGALVESLEVLKPDALEVAVDLDLYPVTEPNLNVLSDGDSIELDFLLRGDERVYYRALKHLDDYLKAVDASPVTAHAVQQAGMFVRIVEEALVDAPIHLVGQVIERASATCSVPSLGDISEPAWPYLARHNRTEPSVKNLLAYIEQFGAIDEDFAALLEQRKELTARWVDNPARVRAVTAVLAASALIPDVNTRVAIAVSANPGPLGAANITPESGRLVGLLLKEGLLTPEVAFSDGVLVDWPSYEFALTQAKLAAQIAVEGVNVKYIAQVITSSRVALALRRQLFSAYIANFSRAAAPVSEVRQVAKAIVLQKWKLTNVEIEALREGGALPRDVIDIISKSLITVGELRGHLRAMGGDYAAIADRGTRRPTFPQDPAHRSILKQLEKVTISRFEPVKLATEGDRYRAWPLPRSR